MSTEPPQASDDYKREKLMVARDSIVRGSGRVQERLADAWISSLGCLGAPDFADNAQRELFERIHVALTKLSAPGVGHVQASTLAMDDATAEGVASDVIELYRRVFGIWD